MEHLYGYDDCVSYCGFDNLPEGLEQYFALYQENNCKYFLELSFLEEIMNKFSLPAETQKLLREAVEAVEGDDKLLYFSRFLVWDMCSARNRCDVDNYNNMTPLCLEKFGELYSFLLLLACVVPSRKLLAERGVPERYYKDIPFQPMKPQLEKLVKGDFKVSDFPWDMNFYTCSIFLMDRFLFIPCRFGDNFTMYRNRTSEKVIALWHQGEDFRRDGQLNGINGVFDKEGVFTTSWQENQDCIIANPVNPMGFVEKDTVTLLKEDWVEVLKPGDMLLALHVPSGPGYNPDRLKNSMLLALEFYQKYFPELPVKGFWSESWLYDSRLSLVLDSETSNIIKVQRQFYLYPVREGDAMLRYEVFGDWKADYKTAELKTSLQKAAAAYMETGARFNNLSMIVLKEEADKTDRMPYITEDDIIRFRQIADSHLR